MPSENDINFIILAVLDGWGIAPPGPGNAITQANTPNMNKFLASYPHTQLVASGREVGLPKGEPGNTETGHVNLGAGKIIYQDLARINMAIAEGAFFNNETLLGAINHVKENNSNLHYMGLVGAGGVHSNIEHLFALIRLAKKENIENLYLHLFTDGRDSPPTSAKIYISKIKEVINNIGVGTIASVMGRYWAMDRDRRWQRTKKAYQALTEGKAGKFKSATEAIDASYEKGQTDEFVYPSIIVDNDGKPKALIKDRDALVFFNFRIDRPRQLSKAFVFKDISRDVGDWETAEEKSEDDDSQDDKTFDRSVFLEDLYFVMMTEYSKPLSGAGANVAFPPEHVRNPLGNTFSSHDLKQLRIAESEKSRFVTYYFNGQANIHFPGEDRIIVPSPKVNTYDKIPQMSALETTDKLIESVRGETQYSFILINYANPDMLGHTGNIGPTVKGVEVVDECLGKIANTVLTYDGALIITADHGNAEEMINPKSGSVDTEHSTNNVPFICVTKKYMGLPKVLQSGILADVAPTILKLLGIKPPESMTGRDLLAELSVD